MSDPIAMLLLLFAFGFIGFGWMTIGKKLYARIKNGQGAKVAVYGLGMAAASYLLAGPRAMAQSDITLDFDLSPLFDAINQYLPVFLTVFGIVGGIAAAMVLSRFVVNAVINAFSGGKI